MKSLAGTKGARHRTNARTAGVIAAVVIMLLGGGALLFGASPALAYTPHAGIEPNPTLATNVTISSHPAGGAPLQYLDQYSRWQNLTAHVDAAHVANPYAIAPSDIVAPGILQGEKVAGTYWNLTGTGTLWHTQYNGLASGSVLTGPTAATVNGEPAVQYTVNTSDADPGSVDIGYAITPAQLPSTNLAFDFLTIGIELAGTAQAGAYADAVVFNQSAGGTWAPQVYASNGTLQPFNGTVAGAPALPADAGQEEYFSISMASMKCWAGTALTCSHMSGASPVTTYYLGFVLYIPKVASTVYTVTVTDLAVGTAPLSLGTTQWHKASVTVAAFGAGAFPANLSAFQPSFTYSSVAGGGYTVAIAQAASDVSASTISAAALTNGSESVTYSFPMGLPAAPSLAYGNAKLTDTPFLAPWQYVAINFAGTSYLSAYQAAKVQGNYTTIVPTVLPTTNASWVGTVTYTESQWLSISGAPGFFTPAGLAYWFWVLVGAFAGLLGIGGTVAYAKSKSGTFRVR